MDGRNLIKHTEPPLFDTFKSLRTMVRNTHVIERYTLYRGSVISTPLFTPYMLYAVVCTIRSMHHTPNIANLYTKFFFTQYASI